VFGHPCKSFLTPGKHLHIKSLREGYDSWKMKTDAHKKAFFQLKLRKGHCFLCGVKGPWRKARRGG